MKQDLYFAHEAAKILNVSPEHVARLGQIIEPDYPAGGKGFRAQYSFRNLVEMRIAEEMAAFSIPRKRINLYLREINHSLLRWLEVDGNDGWLIIGKENWSVVTSFEALSPNQLNEFYLFSINLIRIKNNIRQRLPQ